MTKGKLGLLVVSYETGHQYGYVEAFRANPRVELMAVADEPGISDETRERNQTQAARLGVPYIEDLDRALALPGVDAASVCCGLARRVRVIGQLAAAGKHVFVDKPLATSVGEVDAIGRAVSAAGIHLTVCHHLRFAEPVRQAQKAIRGGRIGLPWSVRAEFLISDGNAAAPGGELNNFGCYVIDVVRYLTGAEFRTVYCLKRAFFYDNAREAGADDFSYLVARMDHGIIAQLSVGRTPYHHHPNGYDGDLTWSVNGTEGTLLLDLNRPRLLVHSEAGARNVLFKRDTLYEITDHFVNAILEGRAPECGVADARAVAQVLEAAHRSAAENRVVSVGE